MTNINPVSFGVDSYHVTVGTGDCSIHLLICKTNPLGGYTVLSAVIIDGGTGGRSEAAYPNPIDKTIQWIQDNYIPSHALEGGILKFSAVVITHWDKDHYGGLLKYFYSDVQGKPSTYQHPNLYWANGNPGTYLYAPYWSRFYDPHGVNPLGANGAPLWLAVEPRPNVEEWAVMMLSAKEFLFSTRVPLFLLRTPNNEFGCPEDRKALGVNLFTNSFIQGGGYANVNTLDSLLQANGPGYIDTDGNLQRDGRAPGLYCIAAKRRILGSGQQPWIPNPPDSRTPSTKNQSSIVVVVLWNRDTGATQPRVSHYLAGDADAAFETLLQQSLLKDVTIKSIKMSHHGSRHSSPLEMVHAYAPTNIIVSNPESGYPHPAWQLVWLLEMWNRSFQVDPSRKIYAARYPHYLLHDSTWTGSFVWELLRQMKVGPFSTESLCKGSFSTDSFVMAYNNLAAGNGAPTAQADLIEYFSTWPQWLNDDNIMERLAMATEKKWDKFGFPLGVHGGEHTIPIATNGRGSHSLAFLRVSSREIATADGDGQVTYMMRGVPDLCVPEFEEWEPTSNLPTVVVDETMEVEQEVEQEDERFNYGGYNWGLNMLFSMADSSVAGGNEAKADKRPRRLPIRGAAISPSNVIAALGTNMDEMSHVPDTDAKHTTTPHQPPSSKPGKVTIPSVGYALFGNRAFDRYKPTGDTTHFGSVSPITETPGLKDLDVFINSLKAGVLYLESAPTRGGSPEPLKLAKGDILLHWIQESLKVDSISARVDPARGIITAFQTTLTLDKLTLDFSSEVSVLGKTFNEKPDATAGSVIPQEPCSFDEPGLMEKATVLCFGLASTSGQVSLKSVLEYMSLKKLSATPLMQFLGGMLLELHMEDGHRNAIWFDPIFNYDTNIRLQLKLVDAANNLLKELLGYLDPQTLALKNTFVIAQKSITQTTAEGGRCLLNRGTVLFVTDIDIAGTTFRGSIEVAESLETISLTLSVLQETAVLETIVTWIKKMLTASNTNENQDFDGSFQDWLKNKVGSSSSFQGLQPRSIRLGLGFAPNAQRQMQISSIQYIKIDFEVNLNYGNAQNPVIFLASFTWQNRPKASLYAISANLWTRAKPMRKVQLLPRWEKAYALEPVTIKSPSTLPETLDLAALCGITDFPDGLPSEVSRVNFLISSDEVAFSGQMVAKTRRSEDGSISKASSVPSLSLSHVDLAARYVFGKSGKKGEWGIQLGFRILIVPKASDVTFVPAEIMGDIAYQSTSEGKSLWKLKGSIEDLSGALLASFFDSDSSSAVADMIGGIAIRSLNVEYDYQGQEASRFLIEGLFILGPVDLSLKFTCDKKKTSTTKESEWAFLASLSLPTGGQQAITTGEAAKNESIKLGSLLKGLLGDKVDEYLPAFVSNIEFTRPTSKDQISMAVKKDIPEQPADATSPRLPTRIVFFLNLDIAGFSFSLLQCKEVRSSTSPPDPEKKAAPATKRILIASLNDIPSVKIPLIGDIEKPIDQILYLWVQDTSEVAEKDNLPKPDKPDKPDKSTTKSTKGITYGDLMAINQTLEASATGGGSGRRLLFKRTKEEYDDKDVVLRSGHHFMMTGKNLKGEVVVFLDYVFDKVAPSKKPAPSAGGGDVKPPTTSPAENASKPSDSPTMASYKKTAGPLSISNIGFGWEGSLKDGGILSISIDASILIGPIGFALMGFKLSFPISAQTSLKNLPAPEVTVDGLSASFHKPPLTIGGTFMHLVVNEKDQYMGAVIISYKAYLFQAAGYYGDVVDLEGKEFKSAFIFCRVNGPLASIGWAELSGLVAGVGYNSSIKFPSAAEVPSFPLIAPPPTAGPLDSLRQLMKTENGGVITPRLDSFWIAAGVKVTAFQVLKVDAVLVLSFDPTIKIGIFGFAVADLPPSPDPGPGKFVHVELGLSATVDVALGVMKIEGQLTPASYILHHDCHLTGGFAMYSWFDSPDPNLNGDWVFTIGGYHRSYTPPAHYPVPPRLGISWSYNQNISIRGEAYFAITPKICMGGGRLDVTLRSGPLRAWFNAYADFLINYQPFQFVAEGGVNVGIECVVDFCIASVTVCASLGATLYLKGPPLAGRITVDFWVTTFSIDFGSDPEPPKLVTLSGFFDLVLKDGGSGGNMVTPSGNSEKETPSPHVFSCQAGLVPKGQGETLKNTPWVVRGAGFAFNVSCKFAIASCKVISAATKDEKATDENSVTMEYKEERIFAKPMKISAPMKSDLEVKIYRYNTSPAFSTTETKGEKKDIWVNMQRVFRPMPSGLWGRYDESTDPSLKNAKQDAMLSTKDGIKQLMTGIDLHAPDAKLSSESPIQFNVAEAMGQDVFETKPTFRHFAGAGLSWAPVTPSDDWEKDKKTIKEDWESRAEIAASVLNAWTSVESFKMWDLKQFNAEVPKETIGKFDEMYMAMPAVTKVEQKV